MPVNQIITELTSEQQALIPVYKEKWRKIACSTQRIDREKAEKAVKAAFELIGEAEPKVFFFDSIFAAINEYNDNDDLICVCVNDNLFQKLRFPLIIDFDKIPEWEFYNLNRFRDALAKDPQNLFEEEFLDKLIVDLEDEIYDSLEEQWNITYFDLLESIDEEKFIPLDTLIPVYREKWRKIALSTERIDESIATEAIKAAYNFFDREAPDIEFFDSPKALDFGQKTGSRV